MDFDFPSTDAATLPRDRNTIDIPARGNIDWRKVGYVMDFSLSAILTSSGKDLASIFFITWLRCILTVASLAPSSAAICLLSIAETTRFITSR